MLAHVEPFSAPAIAILIVSLALHFRFDATNGFHDNASHMKVAGVAPLGAPMMLPVPQFAGWSRL